MRNLYAMWSQVIALLLAVSANGLYRAFSSVFAKGIAKATHFCPTIQDRWIDHHSQEMITLRNKNIFLTSDFDLEGSETPICTFWSTFPSQNILAHLIGGFLRDDVSFNLEGVKGLNSRPRTCSRRIKLEVNRKATDRTMIDIPRLLCSGPYTSGCGKPCNSQTDLWLYSSGDFGISFAGISHPHVFSIRPFTDKPVIVHLVFKMFIDNVCSIRIEQYTWGQRSCQNTLQLPLSCLIYNCSDEDRIFDKINRIPDQIPKSEPKPLNISFFTSQISQGNLEEKSHRNSETQENGYGWMFAWIPCAIGWCGIYLRRKGKTILSLPVIGDSNSSINIPEALELLPPSVPPPQPMPNQNPESNSFSNPMEPDDKDLPPPYESLKPPSYDDAVSHTYNCNRDHGCGISSRSTCV